MMPGSPAGPSGDRKWGRHFSVQHSDMGLSFLCSCEDTFSLFFFLGGGGGWKGSHTEYTILEDIKKLISWG